MSDDGCTWHRADGWSGPSRPVKPDHRPWRGPAGMNVNIWDVTDGIRALVRPGKPVDATRLADPQVPLTDLLRALQAGTASTGVLCTSNHAFPRSRKNPGPLIQALDAWLRNGPPEPPLSEDWLPNPKGTP